MLIVHQRLHRHRPLPCLHAPPPLALYKQLGGSSTTILARIRKPCCMTRCRLWDDAVDYDLRDFGMVMPLLFVSTRSVAFSVSYARTWQALIFFPSISTWVSCSIWCCAHHKVDKKSSQGGRCYQLYLDLDMICID